MGWSEGREGVGGVEGEVVGEEWLREVLCLVAVGVLLVVLSAWALWYSLRVVLWGGVLLGGVLVGLLGEVVVG